MSVYIGKNNASKAVLHATKNAASVAAMQGGVIANNTIFHSDLPFVSFSVYDAIHVIDPYVQGNARKVQLNSTLSGPGYWAFPVTFPEAVFSAENVNKLTILVIDGKVLARHIIDGTWAPFAYNGKVPKAMYQFWCNTPTDTLPAVNDVINSDQQTSEHRYTYVPYVGGSRTDNTLVVPSSIKLYVLTIDKIAGFIPPVSSPSFVHIGNNDINIGGYSMINYSYLSRYQNSSIDEPIYLDTDTIYAVGHNPAATSVIVEATPSRTRFVKGGYTLFDTLLPNPQVAYIGTAYYSGSSVAYKRYRTVNGGINGSIYAPAGSICVIQANITASITSMNSVLAPPRNDRPLGITATLTLPSMAAYQYDSVTNDDYSTDFSLFKEIGRLEWMATDFRIYSFATLYFGGRTIPRGTAPGFFFVMNDEVAAADGYAIYDIKVHIFGK